MFTIFYLFLFYVYPLLAPSSSMSTVIPHPPFCASNGKQWVTFTFTFTISVLSVYAAHVGYSSVHNSVYTETAYVGYVASEEDCT